MAFYEEFLNLEVVERMGGGYAFLTGGGMHHEVAMQNVGSRAPSAHPHSAGLYHVAFEVPDKRSLAEAYEKLKAVGVPVSPVNHLISWAVYFSDPDGNELEIYRDTRDEPGGEKLWCGRNLPIPEEEPRVALPELETRMAETGKL